MVSLNYLTVKICTGPQIIKAFDIQTKFPFEILINNVDYTQKDLWGLDVPWTYFIDDQEKPLAQIQVKCSPDTQIRLQEYDIWDEQLYDFVTHFEPVYGPQTIIIPNMFGENSGEFDRGGSFKLICEGNEEKEIMCTLLQGSCPTKECGIYLQKQAGYWNIKYDNRFGWAPCDVTVIFNSFLTATIPQGESESEWQPIPPGEPFVFVAIEPDLVFGPSTIRRSDEDYIECGYINFIWKGISN